MTLDVFQLRERVVDEYREYVRSFVNVFDTRIKEFVQRRLKEGELWPDAVLQLNPAFEMDQTLGEMAAASYLMPGTARFFGTDSRLYRHQREAIDIAQRGESYVVTTGTGSGKSLTYLVPIYDSILRNAPERHSVRALLIYPMNALINSQLAALENFRDENFPDSPVRFAQYTGQENEEVRDRILKDPPHILLTNYVMAEYILLRPHERPLLSTATRDLRTLVMDELHFYRGRQGADVAMLTRRLQEKAGRDLQAIATSATMVTGGSRAERKRSIAKLTSRFFGLDIPAENVVDETLRKVALAPVPVGTQEVRAAVESNPPPLNAESVRRHPLAAWAEEAFGIEREEDLLVRRSPETFEAAVDRLANESGLSRDDCSSKLQAVLEAGSEAVMEDGNRVFAFRLHQWLSSGNSVYSTLEPPDVREFRMEGQYHADQGRVLFPLAFCRECGQEFYLVSRTQGEDGDSLRPRSPMIGAVEEETEGADGYFTLEHEKLWEGNDDDLPEYWFNERSSGRAIKNDYAEFRPQECAASSDGGLDETGQRGVKGWFQPSPLLICLRCRSVYDRRASDFSKLSPLSQTGRSTATTVGINALVTGLRTQNLPSEEAKSLSFSDNRQDASLQAGHLNDFAQVALLRSAIVKAVRRKGSLTFDMLGPEIFGSLEPRPSDFLRDPVNSGPGFQRGCRALTDLLEYRALEDLSRGWRINQPNLEQTGLLRIDYEGLSELAGDEANWAGLPAIAGVTPDTRVAVLRAILDHLRMQLAIDAEILTDEASRRLAHNANQWLRDPWRLHDGDRLRTQRLALMPGVQQTQAERYQRGVLSLGSRSSIAKYLRSPFTWGLDDPLSGPEADELVRGIVDALRGHLLTAVLDGHNEVRGVRVLAGAMRWSAGTGNPMPPDPVRSRSLHLRREIPGMRQANKYFSSLYGDSARHLRGMVAAEHTGQVAAQDRKTREEDFGEGKLPVLFCSPTMELGVDIRTLNAVHMRNVPPTPANYAQRSGRAGRGGRPALIVTFAAQGNAHDQYYFRNREEMIAGAVSPARMELHNEELVRAHLNSTWLSLTRLHLGNGIADFLDLGDPSFPIAADKRAAIEGPHRDRIFQDALSLSRRIVRRVHDQEGESLFTEEWIEDTLRSAPERLNGAFDTWRDLYRSACDLRDRARRKGDDPHASSHERRDAERREMQARREIERLRNETRGQGNSDFYPYRYLAGEGFLPGYNFPRLPVRTSVMVRDAIQYIDRPRFLGLSEFGPGNQVYHEGRKHRIHSAVLPPEGIESRLIRARLCKMCGYAHEGEAAEIDLCTHCGTRLDASTSDLPQRLLNQPTMRSRAVERISSEEEERVRSGYAISTHFSLTGGRVQKATVLTAMEDAILDVSFAPAALLWRINHGWRRSDRSGFGIDRQNGRWVGRGGQRDAANNDADVPEPLTGVKPYVKDGRNILMLRPLWGDEADQSQAFQLSLLYALKRGIQFNYQVEEQEIGVDLIGQDDHRRLLFWEDAEGGTGVWERLATEPEALARVARQALEICHFDWTTDDDPTDHAPEKCPVACYECLLTYSNQIHHRQIDRQLLPGFLARLASAKTITTRGRDREAQLQRLEGLVDPGSSLEREFLRFLYNAQLRLPDHAQNRPSREVYVQPDFYYERVNIPGVCVFVDGPHHDAADQRDTDQRLRSQLQNLGFRVVTIRYDQPFADQVQRHPDVFLLEG